MVASFVFMTSPEGTPPIFFFFFCGNIPFFFLKLFFFVLPFLPIFAYFCLFLLVFLNSFPMQLFSFFFVIKLPFFFCLRKCTNIYAGKYCTVIPYLFLFIYYIYVFLYSNGCCNLLISTITFLPEIISLPFSFSLCSIPIIIYLCILSSPL